jgi:hypothetical protein
MCVIGTHDDNSIGLLSHVSLREYSKILMWGRTPEWPGVAEENPVIFCTSYAVSYRVAEDAAGFPPPMFLLQ